MLNVEHLRDFVVEPVLKELNLWSLSAEQLVLGTGVHESNLFYLHQIGGGDAVGLFQMQPDTYYDTWTNYLLYRPDLQELLRRFMSEHPFGPEQMAGNINFACAMCRIHYRRHPKKLPPANNARAMAEYWKLVYNTPLGAGSIESFEQSFTTYVQVLYEE